MHFLVNMIVLRGQPSWLSSGLGGPLYLTTYIVSIVTGNIAHLEYTKNPFDKTLCMGASGAISGLYGLMAVSYFPHLVVLGRPRTRVKIKNHIHVKYRN